jgi:hypothetical protein
VSLRYRDAGVWNSDDKVTLRGTRFGGFGSSAALLRTLRTVSSDGSIEIGGNWTIAAGWCVVVTVSLLRWRNDSQMSRYIFE